MVYSCWMVIVAEKPLVSPPHYHYVYTLYVCTCVYTYFFSFSLKVDQDLGLYSLAFHLLPRLEAGADNIRADIQRGELRE